MFEVDEFRKYGAVWDKLGKQLDTARKTVEEAGTRTRAVERRLRGVEVLEGPRAIDDAGDDSDDISTNLSEVVTH